MSHILRCRRNCTACCTKNWLFFWGLQAQLYCLLYEDLAAFLGRADAVKLLEAHGLEVSRRLDPDLVEEAGDRGLEDMRDLTRVLAHMRDVAEGLPPPSPRVVVR